MILPFDRNSYRCRPDRARRQFGQVPRRIRQQAHHEDGTIARNPRRPPVDTRTSRQVGDRRAIAGDGHTAFGERPARVGWALSE